MKLCSRRNRSDRTATMSGTCLETSCYLKVSVNGNDQRGLVRGELQPAVFVAEIAGKISRMLALE